MKKIGILTYHRAINYGALLQAYALRKKLEELGADANMIDYRCPFIEDAYRLTRGMEKKDFRGRMTVIRGIPQTWKKKRRFRRFAKKHLRLTKTCGPDTAKNVCSRFDAVITGSDQVWNMKLCGEDHSYLLDFRKNAGKKAKTPAESVKDGEKSGEIEPAASRGTENEFQKYSYAVSLGDYILTREEAGMLGAFREISLREKRTAEYVARETGRRTRVDIDPTLLLSKEQWEELLPGSGGGGRKAETGRKPYIFLYSVHPQNRMVSYAKKLAKEKNYEIIHLHNRVKKDMREDGVHIIFDSSPEEFLALIHDAACVITNSFHGTVFSILFQKPFLSELETRAGFNNRVWELLQSLGIPRRILDEVPGINDGVTMDEAIDWDLAEQRRRKMAEESVEYLRLAAGAGEIKENYI